MKTLSALVSCFLLWGAVFTIEFLIIENLSVEQKMGIGLLLFVCILGLTIKHKISKNKKPS